MIWRPWRRQIQSETASLCHLSTHRIGKGRSDAVQDNGRDRNLDKSDKNHLFIHHSYKSRGLYKVQLERYLQHFPWEQLLVICSEAFFAEPENTLRQVFEFVGVDTGFKVEDLKPRNVNWNRTKVPPGVYEYLNDYFLPHNQALYELVGKDYGW